MCFSIDVSILLLIVKVIKTQRGKIHLIISMAHAVFDWYCLSIYISKKLRLTNFIIRGFGAFL